jgi:hypothetical protein
MVQEPTTEERLTDLEQLLIKQADQISMLEEELRAVRLMLARVARLNQPESEAA